MNAARLEERRERNFWTKVDRSGECWLWTAARDRDGYGHFLHATGQMAHRYSFELANGPIPAGLVIDHICRNPSCVRPDHLQAVTQKQNRENMANTNPRSASGIRGVSWFAASGKWCVQVWHNDVRHYGGLFAALADAERAAVALRNSLHTNNLVDRRTA